jgi:hypothetical protein
VTAHRRSLRSYACALALTTGLIAPLASCASLDVTHINSSSKKPSNVWVFFTVEKGDEPVAGLTADDFEIYEDDKLVSKFESKQVIQNPDVAAVMYTLLLLDMSGSITESGELDTLVDSAELFATKVGQSQKVGVYAFDGDKKVHSVVPFSTSQGSVEGGLEGLRSYKAKDPSTNLNGAVIQGLEILEKELEKDDRPLKFGTLVVFSDGTDRAARVPKQDMLDEMAKVEYENYEIYAIGVGAEIEESELKELGREGYEIVEEQDDDNVRLAFEKVADRIERHMKRFYLLSYCTPARKGDHLVRIQAESKNDPKGKGELEYEFSADSFGPPPECDPEKKPNFRLDVATEKQATKGKGKRKGRVSAEASAGAD